MAGQSPSKTGVNVQKIPPHPEERAMAGAACVHLAAWQAQPAYTWLRCASRRMGSEWPADPGFTRRSEPLVRKSAIADLPDPGFTRRSEPLVRKSAIADL